MSNIDAGELNKRISIAPVITTTIKGMQHKSFDTTNAISCWTKITGISNNTFYADQNNDNVKNVKNFVIRYRANIANNMLVKYKNKYYEIQDIDNYNEENIFLTLRCKEVKLI